MLRIKNVILFGWSPNGKRNIRSINHKGSRKILVEGRFEEKNLPHHRIQPACDVEEAIPIISSSLMDENKSLPVCTPPAVDALDNQRHGDELYCFENYDLSYSTTCDVDFDDNWA
jgi:hypothetical protein